MNKVFTMKVLLLLFLVGCASASIYDALDKAVDEMVHDFMVGMDKAPSLKRALGRADDNGDEEDIKTELGKKLREHLNDILEKIKDAVEHGKTVKEDVLQKLKELREKMIDMKVDMGAKAKELLQKIKDKTKEFFDKMLEKLGLKDKRAEDQIEAALADLNIKNLFERLKQAILDKIDKEGLVAKIEKIFGKGSEMADELVRILKEKGEKGKNKILEMIDRLIGDKEDKETRSIKDAWDKVKNYFKDLQIDLQEKFAKFGEWVKDTIKGGLDNSKDKLENIKAIAKEFSKHAKDASKEVAVEALEFLRPYKDDLGTLWDQFKDSVKEVLSRKD